jgi:hypothetical protein
MVELKGAHRSNVKYIVVIIMRQGNQFSSGQGTHKYTVHEEVPRSQSIKVPLGLELFY